MAANHHRPSSGTTSDWLSFEFGSSLSPDELLPSFPSFESSATAKAQPQSSYNGRPHGGGDGGGYGQSASDARYSNADHGRAPAYNHDRGGEGYRHAAPLAPSSSTPAAASHTSMSLGASQTGAHGTNNVAHGASVRSSLSDAGASAGYAGSTSHPSYPSHAGHAQPPSAAPTTAPVPNPTGVSASHLPQTPERRSMMMSGGPRDTSVRRALPTPPTRPPISNDQPPTTRPPSQVPPSLAGARRQSRALPTPPSQSAAPSAYSSLGFDSRPHPSQLAPAPHRTSSTPSVHSGSSAPQAPPAPSRSPVQPAHVNNNASPLPSADFGVKRTGTSSTTSTQHTSYDGHGDASVTPNTSMSSKYSHEKSSGYHRSESAIPEVPLGTPEVVLHEAPQKYDRGRNESGGHQRTNSYGFSEAGLPPTPKAPPIRTLDHMRSFLQESDASRSSLVASPSVYSPAPTDFPSPSVHTTPSATQLYDMYGDRTDDSDRGLEPSEQERELRQSHANESEDYLNFPSSSNHLQVNDSGAVGSSSHAPDHAPDLSPSWAEQSQPPSRWVQNKLLLHQIHQDEGLYDEDVYDDDYGSSAGELEDEVNGISFFNPALITEMAVQVRDHVPRGNHFKSGILWGGTFTGNDLVSSIQQFLPKYTRESENDRRFALITARTLQSQLFVFEVEWEDTPIRDAGDGVFKFMSEMEGLGDAQLPSGVLTMATKCYSPGCVGGSRCYAPRCPNKTPPGDVLASIVDEEPPAASSRTQASLVQNDTDWAANIDPVLFSELTDSQRERQTSIRKAIRAETEYEADLAAVEQVFITPLQTANPPIFQQHGKLEQIVRQIFINILDIRRASRRLIDNFAIRAREQEPLINIVGDIFLEAATDFRALYSEYIDNMPASKEALTQALEENAQFARWVDSVSNSATHRWDLRFLLERPATHLKEYPSVIEEILKHTDLEDPDYDFIQEALTSIRNISYVSQLRLFQQSKGRGAKLQWHEIAPNWEAMEKKESKRQMLIWEFIQGEMEYVADLEAIETVFITPLREAERPIIERSRLDIFIDDAFHNYRSILDVHQRLLEALQQRQREQHPRFGMISDLILDAALNWNEAYLEYMPHYPIAKAKIDDERNRNVKFKTFLEEAQHHEYSNRHEINHFMYRPIARLLRYPLLLKEILSAQKAVGPDDHPDIDTIPQVIDLIDKLAKAGQKGVAVNKAKVELWHLKTTLDGGKISSRAVKDLDLMNPMRELIHKGKVYRQPEGTMSTWTELHILLFDNYFVMVKQTKASNKNKDAPTKYAINRRPIPLELLSLGEFSDPGQTRSLGLLKGFRGNTAHESEAGTVTQTTDQRVFPFTYSFIGQSSGTYTLWTDSEKERKEWHEKLTHAKVLRSEVNDAGKVFEMTPLSLETFHMAPGYGMHPMAGQDDFTGRVTCSVPFVTIDRRSLVAVGCEQGVWIGVRHDPSSLRKVLHVQNVTNIAVLEEFGIFLVLADKSLLAYHLEALVPTATSQQVRSAPQRLSGMRDIVFFTVGQISGRTLVLYMKRKGMDSVFRVLEPILNRGQDAERQRRPFGSLLGTRLDWFRVYKDFFIPTEATHVHFLKAKLAIVCVKNFEIMDLADLKGGSIPIFDERKVRERPLLAELAKRCEQAKPLAMFRSTDSEFLLCYESFGIYVDRHGEPNRDCQPIEWEGCPQSVAFHPPYLLLVSPSFIEVRHIDTAKLLQIYTGSDIRCTWDGTTGQVRHPPDHPGPKGWGDEISSQEPRIHICKRTDDARRTHGIAQHIFELTPTLLLNNPLLNPVHTQDPNYFPPAPLAHRTSISSNHSNGFGSSFPMDRRSISSASTTTYNGGGGGGAGPGPGRSPAVPGSDGGGLVDHRINSLRRDGSRHSNHGSFSPGPGFALTPSHEMAYPDFPSPQPVQSPSYNATPQQSHYAPPGAQMPTPMPMPKPQPPLPSMPSYSSGGGSSYAPEYREGGYNAAPPGGSQAYSQYPPAHGDYMSAGQGYPGYDQGNQAGGGYQNQPGGGYQNMPAAGGYGGGGAYPGAEGYGNAPQSPPVTYPRNPDQFQGYTRSGYTGAGGYV